MAKGESIADTARVVSGYSDVLVVRHPDVGSVAQFADASVVPVVNAGDGAGEHPSQALLDVYTLEKELAARGRSVDGCRIAILGDLKYGRTVHSLMKLMSLYNQVHFVLFSPPSLELPQSVADYAIQRGHTVSEADSAVEAVHEADVVYATRVQRERMTEELAQATTRGDLLNRAILRQANNESVIIMHPLPRDCRSDAFDLSPDVDDLPGLAIFKQTDNGLNVRMAIFLTTLGVSTEAVQLTTKQRSWKATLRDSDHGLN
jgi:aspartate carbamoyltransferase catalytic subunit